LRKHLAVGWAGSRRRRDLAALRHPEVDGRYGTADDDSGYAFGDGHATSDSNADRWGCLHQCAFTGLARVDRSSQRPHDTGRVMLDHGHV
jgi:hypothetical protein